MANIRLPPLSTVKKALYADWALRVKQLDGWRCLLCGCEENLTAHHWIVSDHFAHAARYHVGNGATLCYACHIRAVHTRADWVIVDRLRYAKAAILRASFGAPTLAPSDIDAVIANVIETSKIELTTERLRKMWDALRERPVSFLLSECSWRRKGEKLFVSHRSSRQIAVVGNTAFAPGTTDLHEVKVVARRREDRFRYTLAAMEPNE